MKDARGVRALAVCLSLVAIPGFGQPPPGAPLPALLRAADGAAGGEVEVALLALPMRALEGDQRYLAVVLEIDGETLAAGAEDAMISAEVTVVAVDAAGAVADRSDQRLSLGPPAATDGLSAVRVPTDIKVETGLRVAPGAYSVRALVRHTVTGRHGRADAAVTVAAAPPVLLAPVFPERTDLWRVVDGARPELAAAAPAARFEVEGQPFLPAVRPAVYGGSGVPVVIMGYGLRGRESMIGSVVLDQDGLPVPGSRLLVSSVRATDAGLDRVLGILHLPSLPGGRYSLALDFTDAASSVEHTVASSFQVVGGNRRASALLAFVTREPPPPTAPLPAPSLAPAAPALAPSVVAGRYRRALATLEARSRAEVVTELGGLEAEAVGGDPEGRIGRLRRTELDVAEELGRRDREILVPVMMLHHDLCLEHKRQRRTYLAHHSIAMVQALARRYAPASSAPGARIVAARALASLGGHLQASGQRMSLQLFEEALHFDPDHEAALLGLAAFPEKIGGPYDQAVRHLEHLVAAHPESREGRLRLAVNLRRLSHGPSLDGARRREQAIAHLQHLLLGDNADWVTVLAAQELARSLDAAERTEEAISVLRNALARVPDAQKLRIQLAFLYDRNRQPGQARAVLQGLDGMRVPRNAARGRYNQWPNQALTIDRALLAESAAQRRALLGRLAAAGGGGV